MDKICSSTLDDFGLEGKFKGMFLEPAKRGQSFFIHHGTPVPPMFSRLMPRSRVRGDGAVVESNGMGLNARRRS